MPLHFLIALLLYLVLSFETKFFVLKFYECSCPLIYKSKCKNYFFYCISCIGFIYVAVLTKDPENVYY